MNPTHRPQNTLMHDPDAIGGLSACTPRIGQRKETLSHDPARCRLAHSTDPVHNPLPLRPSPPTLLSRVPSAAARPKGSVFCIIGVLGPGPPSQPVPAQPPPPPSLSYQPYPFPRTRSPFATQA